MTNDFGTHPIYFISNFMIFFIRSLHPTVYNFLNLHNLLLITCLYSMKCKIEQRLSEVDKIMQNKKNTVHHKSICI